MGKPDIRMDVGKLKRWLGHHMELSAQNPWLLARENPGSNVIVTEVDETPVMLFEQQCATTIRPSLIRPDLIPDVRKACDALDTDPAYLGFFFCPPDAIPQEFQNHEPRTFRQAVQYTGDFDATLYGPVNRHLRQNLSRGEKHGLTFEPNMTYRSAEISDVVLNWVAQKHFALDNLDVIERALKSGNRLESIAHSPFGVLYGVRAADGALRAVAGVIEAGEYASIECVASCRGTDRAQEYLETNMWREFARKDIKTVDRGMWDKQSASLKAHKEKFARMQMKDWACANPLITKSYGCRQY